MRHRLSVGLLIAGAAVAVIFGWPFFSVLEISDLNTGRAVLCARMRAGEEFVLAFTHSVNRRPVYDTLRAEGDHLVIVKSRFDSFGAGMPDATTDEGTLIVTPDGWLEWTVNRPVPEITVRVGRVAEHKLNLKGREIRLADLAQPGAPLNMRVRKARMLDLMKGRCVP